MSYILWVGMLLACRQNSMLLRPACILQSTPKKTLRRFVSKFNIWASRLIGAVKLIRHNRSITVGHSGFFYNYLSTAWRTWMKSRSGGARNWGLSWPTKRSLMENRNGEVFPLSVATYVNGFYALRVMRISCWTA